MRDWRWKMVPRWTGPHGARRAGRAFHSPGPCVAPCRRPYLSEALPALQPRRATLSLATGRLKNVVEIGRSRPCLRHARTGSTLCTASLIWQGRRQGHGEANPHAKSQRHTLKTRRDMTMSGVHRDLLVELPLPEMQRLTRTGTSMPAGLMPPGLCLTVGRRRHRSGGVCHCVFGR